MSTQPYDLTLSYAATDRKQFRAATIAAVRQLEQGSQPNLSGRLAGKFSQLSGQTIGNDVVIMNSASDALRVAAETLGKKTVWGIIYPSPMYLEKIISACSAPTAAINEDDFLSPEKLDTALIQNPQIEALSLVMPNNPTGRELSAEQFKSVAALCAKHDVTLVCDFALRFFGHLNEWDQYAILRESGAKWIAIEETKKTFGLHQKGVAIMTASDMRSIPGQASKYAPVSDFDKALVLDVMEKTASAEDIVAVKNARLNYECLEAHGIHTSTAKGMPFADSGDLGFHVSAALANAGIQAMPMHEYYGVGIDTARHARISLSGDPAEFSKAMDHLSAKRGEIFVACDASYKRFCLRF